MTIDVAIPLHWQSSRSGQSWTGPSASFHCFCMDIIRRPQICGILCSNDNASANFKARRPRYRLSVQAQAITLSNAWMVVSISVAMCPIGLPLDTYIRDAFFRWIWHATHRNAHHEQPSHIKCFSSFPSSLSPHTVLSAEASTYFPIS